ncbi:unnamed protein product [Paramecium sonneborni]|uniref:Uncharacterized protein n=1 Tax=Paramecium sonneborni TaxID=65129 RepID=A0A8S1RTV9_9CILI|nr:unnamed protein product [Paramecium sonneborni]
MQEVCNWNISIMKCFFVSCGQICSSFDSNGICQYCETPPKYFQTFDSHNYQPCCISSCVYYYLYYVKNGIAYTPLDLNYSILQSSQEQFYIGCALCQANLNLTIYQTTIENSFSRIQGGGIYVVTSQQFNYVNLQNLTIRNCFSIQYGFFSDLLSSLQSLNSKVTFSGIQFQVTKVIFIKFLSLLESPTKSDIDVIRNNNPFIKIKFGFVSIENCSFISTHIQFLIDIEFATNILIKDIFILNSTILYSPLIRLSLKQKINGNITLININAINVQQHTNYSVLKCQISTYPTLDYLTCRAGIPQENSITDDYDTSLQYEQQQQLCNEIDVYQQANYSFSLFEIDNLNSIHSLQVEGLNFDFIICGSCEYGILRIKRIMQSQIENILFNNIKIVNSQCGQQQETIQLDVLLSNNNSTLYGSDVFENPRSLTISIDGGQTFLNKIQVKQSSIIIIEKVVITPYKIFRAFKRVKYLTFPSGRQIFSYKFFDLSQSKYIPYNLTFHIIALNKYNSQEKKLAGTICTLQLLQQSTLPVKKQYKDQSELYPTIK